MFLGNNAIVWNVLDRYLWHIKEANRSSQPGKENPLTMRTDKNLFLYFYNYYTLAIVPLRSALSTITALPRLLQTDQQATLLNALIIPEM